MCQKTQHFITLTVIAISTTCVFGQKSSESASLTTEEAKQIQDATIGSIYDLVRDINHNVAGIAGEIISKAAEMNTERKSAQADEKTEETA